MWDFLQTKGSDDPKIYWFRRLLVVGIPLVLILAVVAISWPRGTTTVTNPSPSLSMPTVTPTVLPPSISPSAVAVPTGVQPSGTITAAAPVPPASAKPPAPELPPPPEVCEGSDIRVSIDDMSNLVSGQTQELRLGFTNKGEKTCLLNVNSKLLTIRVVSGNDKIWTTTTCSNWVPEVKAAKVEAGVGHSLKISWPGKRGIGGCDLSNEKLGAGTYRIEVSYEGANTFKKSVLMQRG